MDRLGFIRFVLQLGDVTRPVEALVISSLRPDDIQLDNSVMSLFGAKLDWKNQSITFHSSEATIPAVHRVNTSTPGSSLSSAGVTFVSAASVHADFEAIPVSLKSRFYLPAGTEASVVVFIDTKPLVDTDVVLEPRMISQSEFSECNGAKTFQTFERVVARTTATWRAADGSIWLQIANPSTRSVTIPAHLTLAPLSTATVTGTPELRIRAVAASPKNKDELAVAREALEPALAKAFADTTFSPEQVSEVVDLCAKYRPVFSLSPDELGCCKIAEATFPLQPGTRSD